MKVELHNEFDNPEVKEATRVLILDSFDNPLVLVYLFDKTPDGREHHRIHKVTDDDFNSQLRASGVDRTVIVKDMKLTRNN